MSKIIFFDFDNTLINFNSWEKFNIEFAFSKEEDSLLFNLYKKEIIDYSTWLKIINKAIIKNNKLTKKSLLSFCNNLSMIRKNKETLAHFKNHGYRIVIISGGIKQIIELLARNVFIDEILSTSKIIWTKNGDFKKIKHSGDEQSAKLKLFLKNCHKYKVNPKETIMVGNGDNDLEIFKNTNEAILIGKNQTLKQFARFSVNNLTEIKKILN